MIAWSGAADGVITNDATVVAGVASMIIAAQNATAALGIFPGTASVSFVAQAPSAGLSALPGTGSITLGANGPQTAVGARPGTASVSVSALGPAVGLAVIPNAAPVSFTAQQANRQWIKFCCGECRSGRNPHERSRTTAGVGALTGTRFGHHGRAVASTGITALPAPAAVSFTGYGGGHFPAAGRNPHMISGREPLAQLYGRQPISSASGQDTGPISGRQPLSSNIRNGIGLHGQWEGAMSTIRSRNPM